MTFPPKNNIIYTQDFKFLCGVPHGVDFAPEVTVSGLLILRAPGYGNPENYGDGILVIHLKIGEQK